MRYKIGISVSPVKPVERVNDLKLGQARDQGII